MAWVWASSVTRRALACVVRHGGLGHHYRLGLGLVLEGRLQLGDPLGGLAQSLTALAELLLEALGLDGGLLQVLVDIVPVVSLERLAELDGSERIKC